MLMANKQAIAKEVARGKKLLEDLSRDLGADRERHQMFFPSLHPTSRKHISPLGGTAEFPWGPKKKDD
jgi:hypothetical protein